jgi:DNA-binding transcriptional regulator of glucitol operon
MKRLKWAVAAVVIAACVALLAGQKDIRRFLRMRRM